MQSLFSQSFRELQQNDKELAEIYNSLDSIDKMIAKSAPQFPIPKIAKIDVAILRLAVYELTVEKKNPAKVIIDEAIELAKEFGSENSASFINGVLGTIYKNQK